MQIDSAIHVKSFEVDGKTLYIAPKLSGYYNIAGQAVVAKLMGYELVKAGAYCRGSAVALAKACRHVGLECFIVLGCKASVDQALLGELEAMGVFGGLMDAGCMLATCEEPICQEFHLGESGTYTIATRSALHNQMDTTLCPELVNWWRKARVARLGCDRLGEVDVGAYGETGLSAAEARAAALAFNDLGCKKLLVVGGHI